MSKKSEQLNKRFLRELLIKEREREEERGGDRERNAKKGREGGRER